MITGTPGLPSRVCPQYPSLYGIFSNKEEKGLAGIFRPDGKFTSTFDTVCLYNLWHQGNAPKGGWLRRTMKNSSSP